MSHSLRIIYIPGLGDRYDPLRRASLKLWRLYGAEVTMVPMLWHSNEEYDAKRKRIEAVIEERAGEPVVLMGESAGGSMALTLYAKYAGQSVSAMTLCGKNTRPDNVSPYLYKRNPAFQESMFNAEAAIATLALAQRQRFISVVPLHDATVPVKQTLLPDCQKMTLPVVGHLLSILAMLTIYAPLIVRRAKKL